MRQNSLREKKRPSATFTDSETLNTIISTWFALVTLRDSQGKDCLAMHCGKMLALGLWVCNFGLRNMVVLLMEEILQQL